MINVTILVIIVLVTIIVAIIIHKNNGNAVITFIAGSVISILAAFLMATIVPDPISQYFRMGGIEQNGEDDEIKEGEKEGSDEKTSIKSITQEQYEKALRYLEDGHYQAAVDTFFPILYYSDVQNRLYLLAIQKENDGEYYFALDIYRVLAREMYEDSQEKYDYFLDKVLPIESFVGTWLADDYQTNFEITVYRDAQNNYYADVYNNPKDGHESDTNPVCSWRCNVSFEQASNKVIAKTFDWIKYPNRLVFGTYNLPDNFTFMSIDKNSLVGYGELTYVRKPDY